MSARRRTDMGLADSVLLLCVVGTAMQLWLPTCTSATVCAVAGCSSHCRCDARSEAAYLAAALAAAGLAAVAAKVWTGTGAHTPVVPRHMQPGSNRTGGPQKKGAPAASPIKMGEFENVSSESEKEDYVSEEEDYEAGTR